MSPRSVYVHVGLPKTGTTYLQRALWQSRDRLAGRGVLVPGEGTAFHKRAAWDLLGRRARGAEEPEVAGAWQAMVDEVARAGQDSAVISEEFFVYARPRHIRQLERALSPAELHIVVTARDLGRVIGSAWQHELTKGHSWSWPDFLDAVRDPSSGPASAGVGFWLRYDLKKVLSTWEELVSPERVHVVVVPAAGAAPTVLLQRFAEAVAVDPGLLTPPPDQVNSSIGVTEAEVLRRLNEQLAGRLNERQYVRTVKGAVIPALGARSASSRIRLPDEHLQWATERSADWVAHLRGKPFHVVGDPAELMPQAPADGADRGGEPAAGGADPRNVDESEVAAATSQALAAAVETYATFWWKARRRQESRDADAKTKVVSAGRALGYKTRAGALRKADSSRLMGKAANAYLRRSSRDD